jgi:hypothetical protein
MEWLGTVDRQNPTYLLDLRPSPLFSVGNPPPPPAFVGCGKGDQTI